MFRYKLLTLILLSTAVGHSLAAGAAEPAQIAEGERLYNQNCVFCHQPDAIGKPGFAPSLTNPELLATASDKFLMGTIRDGRPGTGMAPFAHIGRKRATAVVA